MIKKELVVGAIIVDDLDHPQRVLATRRSRPAELAGHWEFPGGKVDPGEEPTEALKRELAEELQISVVVGDELHSPTIDCWPISATYEMRVWFVRISAGQPAPTDSHDGTRWLEPSELKTVKWLDADVAVVDELIGWFASQSR